MKPQQWCECTHPWMMRMLQLNATMMCCHMCHCQSHDSLCEWSMSRRASDEWISNGMWNRLSRLRGQWLIMCRGIISFFTTPQLKKTAEWSTNHITWTDQAHVTTWSITGDRPVRKLVATEVVSEPSAISPIKQHMTKPNPIRNNLQSTTVATASCTILYNPDEFFLRYHKRVVFSCFRKMYGCFDKVD